MIMPGKSVNLCLEGKGKVSNKTDLSPDKVTSEQLRELTTEEAPS